MNMTLASTEETSSEAITILARAKPISVRRPREDSTRQAGAFLLHIASTVPGDQNSDFWYGRDIHGDMRFLRSMVGGVVLEEASATSTPPLTLPATPLLHQYWPSNLNTEWSVRDLNAAAQGVSGLLKARIARVRPPPP